MSKTKAIALFSGGLDSILSVKIMLELGIDVYPITYLTPFSGTIKSGCEAAPRRICEKLGIPLKVKFLGKEFIELVKNPRHGYGKNMNPCIDCRILMLRKAKKYMEEIGAEFIITGEVLGERPMTQNKKSMKLIETKSELEGKIVRPLSARLLEPTIPEQQGTVKRKNLLAIEGRSRKPQMKLAQELYISDYPTPAGGCLLTDPVFAKRIKDAFKYNEDSLREISLLKYGRHFRLTSRAKVIVGRNEKENEIILALKHPSCTCLEAYNLPSPIVLLLTTKKDDNIEKAASICLRYSDCKEEKGRVDYWQRWEEKEFINVKKMRMEEIDEIRI
ncbi:hypothetical protein KAX75_02810 [candidate division WOR-3 bacterium]|nr:hypothetical protein [candidate division WOR-3 bacterium]